MSEAWLVCKGLKCEEDMCFITKGMHWRNWRSLGHTSYAGCLSTSGGFCDWYSCTICLRPIWDKSLDHLVSLEILGMFFRVAWKCSYYSIAIAGVPCDTLWCLFIAKAENTFLWILATLSVMGYFHNFGLMQLTQRVRKIQKCNGIADWPADWLCQDSIKEVEWPLILELWTCLCDPMHPMGEQWVCHARLFSETKDMSSTIPGSPFSNQSELWAASTLFCTWSRMD